MEACLTWSMLGMVRFVMMLDTEEEEYFYKKIHMLIKTVMKRVLTRDRTLQDMQDDLNSVGFEAAVKARSKYDPNHPKKANFYTFVYYCIRSAIYLEIRRAAKHRNIRHIEEFSFCHANEDIDSAQDYYNGFMSCSCTDAVIPYNLDRYEKLVIKWRVEQLLVKDMRKKLKNLRSKRTLEEIEQSIREKIKEANITNK